MAKQNKRRYNLLKRVSGGDTVINGNLNTTGDVSLTDNTIETRTDRVDETNTTNVIVDIYKKKKCFLGICW